MRIHLKDTISEEYAGLRLDQALAKLFPQYSRSQLQSWVQTGCTTVDRTITTKNKQFVYPGQIIEIITTLVEKENLEGEDIPLEIIYEDESVLVINKPPGIVVHPGAGNPKSTLVNALLHYDPNLKKLPRAGLVHRLDKDTSGILLVAKTLEAQTNLVAQMQLRSIQRIYHAIVKGHTQMTGTINQPIGRHPTQRTKMSVLKSGGKEAITHYQLLEKLPAHSYLEIKLETGRTHQIRVHMAYIDHSVLGDAVYGKKAKNIHLSPKLSEIVTAFKRQALHAKKISFIHPTTQEVSTFESPLPIDFQELLQALQEGIDKSGV
jgi:23S rRNA pseudouridine1911/1915/1917 synthase